MQVKRKSIRRLAGLAIGTIFVACNLTTEAFGQGVPPSDERASTSGAAAAKSTTPDDKTLTQPAAVVTGTEPGWESLSLSDFYNVNCLEGTWSEEDNIIRCNGSCNGGLSSKRSYKNFELMMQWQHQKRSGNSGLFIWSPKSVLDKMKKGELPQGIEIQILDHGYAQDWEKSNGSPPNWFTTHGDIFPCGIAKMKPFQPAAPNGKRSFPRAKHSKGAGQWNQYYVRAINGEVRLWVNGHEVSGGNQCDPATGHIVLEAEGAPVLFRNLLIRELP